MTLSEGSTALLASSFKREGQWQGGKRVRLGYGTEVGIGDWGFIPEDTEVARGTLQKSWGH